MKWLIISTLLIAWAILSWDDNPTQDKKTSFDLYDSCRKETEASPALPALCSGYIKWASTELDKLGNDFCIPNEITSKQIVNIVKLWMLENPQHSNYSESLVVSKALEETWPCI